MNAPRVQSWRFFSNMTDSELMPTIVQWTVGTRPAKMSLYFIQAVFRFDRVSTLHPTCG
jgi:hypothetical protein